MFFTMLLFELLPFCYVSFYSWDRKFFLADRVSGTYATSAYFTAHMLAGKLLGNVALCLAPVYITSCSPARWFSVDFTLVNCLTRTNATSVQLSLLAILWSCSPLSACP